MEDKIFDFSKSKDALSQLLTDLEEVNTNIKIKKDQLKTDKQNQQKLLKEKDNKIKKLKSTITDTKNEIDEINKYIEGIL